MKKTVYVYDDGAVINKVGTHLQVRVKDHFIFEEPFSNIDSIICFKQAQITTQCLSAAMMEGIHIVYTTRSSKIIGFTYARYTDRPQLKIAQYSAVCCLSQSLKIAKELVTAKIIGQQNTLSRYRLHEGSELKTIIAAVPDATDKSQLMGYEGAAAAIYFRSLKKLDNIKFSRRETHPAYDPVNALLNLTYMMALYKMDAILNARGFDSALGFLHTIGTDRAALSYDILEPFRGLLDRFVIKILNRKEVTDENFIINNEGCVLNKKGFAKFIQAYTKNVDIVPIAEQIIERLKKAIYSKKGEFRFELADMHSLL